MLYIYIYNTNLVLLPRTTPRRRSTSTAPRSLFVQGGRRITLIGGTHEGLPEYCGKGAVRQGALRAISLLTLSLLTLLDSSFPRNSLWAWKSQPLNLRLCLSQTLCDPKC